MAPQLGWAGLGNMGRGMCKNLCEKGNLDKPLLIYNRTTSRAEDLSQKLGGSDKSKVAKTIEEVVGPSDIIFFCLGDDAAVTENVDAFLKNNVKGKLFVDCSTIHPKTSNSIADKIKKAGAHFVACPVFGAPAMADSGQLVCVIAGSQEDIDKMKPYTKGVMARENIEYSGQEPGNALRMKIIGNTFILNMVESLAEGHTLAEKSGLGNDNLHQFLTIMFPGPFAAYSTRMTSGDYFNREEPLFQVDLALKDANHALDLASASGTTMRGLEVGKQHLQDVKKAKAEKGDLAGIYGAVRQESGLNYENS